LGCHDGCGCASFPNAPQVRKIKGRPNTVIGTVSAGLVKSGCQPQIAVLASIKPGVSQAPYV
jgi:hypothetical protein